MKTLAAIALALPLLPTCSSSGGAAAQAPAEVAVAFESLARAEQSGLNEAGHQVVRTEQGWTALWERIVALRMPSPPAPAVDFASEMVVVVALGERTTAGHGVEVVAVERDGAYLRVRARATAPAPGSGQAMVLTHPFHAVRVPRSEGPVTVVVD